MFIIGIRIEHKNITKLLQKDVVYCPIFDFNEGNEEMIISDEQPNIAGFAVLSFADIADTLHPEDLAQLEAYLEGNDDGTAPIDLTKHENFAPGGIIGFDPE